MKNKSPVGIRRILSFFLGALFVLLFLALLVNAWLSKKEGKPTFIGGYALLWVSTGSMEPTIPARSYILVRASDGVNLPVGTVVTYRSRDTSSPVYGCLVTHRITACTTEGYRTAGDNEASHQDPVALTSSDVVATCVANLPILSAVGRVFASPVGLILILTFFLFLITFLYIPDIISVLKEGKKEKTEEDKEAMIQKRIEEEIKKLEEERKGGEKK